MQAGEAESIDDAGANARTAKVQRQRRLLIIGLIFTAPLIVYSMARDFGLISLTGDEYAMLIAAFFPRHRTEMMLLMWAISWAVALAAALFRPEAVAGPAVIVVASGGNVDVALHRKAMERFGAA